MFRRRSPIIPLRSLDLFRDCTGRELQHALALTTPVWVPAGTVIAAQASSVREFILIVAGVGQLDNRYLSSTVVGPSDFVGETVLGQGSRHDATFRALTGLDVLVSTPREFDQLLGLSPNIPRRLFARLALRTERALNDTARRVREGQG